MEDEEMIDDYLDCTGKRRRFRVMVYGNGRFLQAVEVCEGEASGLRFVLPVRAGEAPPWGEIRKRIRERLATRSVVRDEHGRLELVGDVLRGQIGQGQGGMPSVVVDDLELSWEEVGALLQPCVGFGLRIEIHEPGHE
jgi:hypothetical protein